MTAESLSTMEVQIVSIDFDVELENQQGNKYTGCEVVYKSGPDEKIYQKAMHNNTFRFNKTLRKQLEELKKGDYVEVTFKKEGSFVNWQAAEKIDAPASAEKEVANASVESAAKVETKETKVEPKVRSTYETPEERARRNVMIVRQSSITAALKLAELAQSAGNDYTPTEEDIIASAKVFEKYVLGHSNEVEVKLPE